MIRLRTAALSAVCGIASVAFLGCADPHVDLPPNAQEMSAGSHRLAFTATQPGSVVVEDVQDHSILYRGLVKTGDIVIVDPDQNQVTINGMVVENKRLHAGDEHRIFFAAPLSSLNDRGAY